MIDGSTSIRPATIEDLGDLLPLIRQYRVFYGQESDRLCERAFLERHLRERTSSVFIAFVAGEVAGFVQLFQTYSTVKLGSILVLEDLFVVPRFRSRGVGEELMQTALEHARQQRAVGMFLETAFDNQAAQRLYRRCGWALEDEFLKFNAPL